MDLKLEKIVRLLMIGFILITLITVTGCVSEEKDDDDDNGNGGDGDDGDGGNGNNTTNGDKQLVTFKGARVTPDNPNTGERVTFEVSTESENYIEELSCIVCIKDDICFSPPVTMERIQITKDDWIGEWTIPEEAKGKTLEYNFLGKDSLNNPLESIKYSFQVQ